jgi:hypothetical protein
MFLSGVFPHWIQDSQIVSVLYIVWYMVQVLNEAQPNSGFFYMQLINNIY